VKKLIHKIFWKTTVPKKTRVWRGENFIRVEINHQQAARFNFLSSWFLRHV